MTDEPIVVVEPAVVEPVSDRPVFQYTGPHIPSALQEQLQVAGITCRGVTYTLEDPPGTFTLQVICEVGTAQADVDAAVAAYTPPTD